MVWLGHRYTLNSGAMNYLLALLTVLSGLLMVSNLRYYSFKSINLSRPVSFAYLLLIPLIIAMISLNPPLVLFLLALSYALSGPILWASGRAPRRLALLDDDDHDDDDNEPSV